MSTKYRKMVFLVNHKFHHEGAIIIIKKDWPLILVKNIESKANRSLQLASSGRPIRQIGFIKL